MTESIKTSTRISSIDMCRGILFILMTNTHALGLTQIEQHHWARSDLWLPNGWATVVFVVLSGYAAGYLLSERNPEAERDQLLRRRAFEILFVMLASNVIFAILGELARGQIETILNIEWYIGFITLSTEWTISGVLLPTGLLLFIAPWIMRRFQNSQYWLLAGLMSFQLIVSAVTLLLKESGQNETWLVKFFFTEGFGGFPVIPFLINGCFGIWLGMKHKQNQDIWLSILTALVVLQIILYCSTFFTPSVYWSVMRSTTGAIGKFGCIFLVAIIFIRILPNSLTSPIEIMGRYALGSFVMHRIFLQAFVITAGATIQPYFNSTSYYLIALMVTIFLTWLHCKLRHRSLIIDYSFRILKI